MIESVQWQYTQFSAKVNYRTCKKGIYMTEPVDKKLRSRPNQPTINDSLMSHESWKIFQVIAEFVEGYERLVHIRPSVSIFGSARTKPEDPYYQFTEAMAEELSLLPSFTVVYLLPSFAYLSQCRGKVITKISCKLPPRSGRSHQLPPNTSTNTTNSTLRAPKMQSCSKERNF